MKQTLVEQVTNHETPGEGNEVAECLNKAEAACCIARFGLQGHCISG